MEKILPVPCCPAMQEYIIEKPKLNEGLEFLDGGGWAINGCCRGGCFVLLDFHFCPFCGKQLVPALALAEVTA